MDSLTQIVLGAAVGEVVLGKKVGNKAMLYGAIAGTIPDLDVLASQFTDTVNALDIHRGFTHSIVFSVLFAPIFGWLVSRYEKLGSFKDWSWLFFWGFLTHPLLDAHTTWGTQLFWPLDLRLAYKNIFVIDPLYTIPFLICVIWAMRLPKISVKRRKINWLGIILSSSYLVITLLLKAYTYPKFTQALEDQEVDYTSVQTKPSAFNSILWTANVDTPNAYLIGHYSIFDTQPIQFASYPKQHELLGELKDEEKVQQLIRITEGWYSITQKEERLFFNDLRFGVLGFAPGEDRFVFSYELIETPTGLKVEEVEKDREQAKELVGELGERILGN
ncbi:MAG: metal-dependent hydrolase [Mesonia sp.]|uniref:metal-dependent hydrolase n=1 Tax=Mesonia sp. TaxID=1960830 RepID=UPI003F960BA4